MKKKMIVFPVLNLSIILMLSGSLLPQDKIMEKSDPSRENTKITVEDVDLYTVPGGGFHDSMFRISFIYGGNIINPWGEMMNKEERLYDSSRSSLPSGSQFQNDEVAYSERSIGADIDYMFQSVKYCQRLKFDLTGIKFGIRAGYSSTRVNQYLYLYPGDNSGDPLFKSSGRIIEYQTWQAGPTADIIFSPRSNLYNILLHAYVLIGYIADGNITAASALRDAGISYDREEYDTNFNGISFSLGFGPHLVLNRWVPVTIGVNLKYTHAKFFLDKSIAVYGKDRTVSFNSFGAELSCGIHFL